MKENSEQLVLIDDLDGGRLWEDAPEIDFRVIVDGLTSDDLGQLIRVRIDASNATDYFGEKV